MSQLNRDPVVQFSLVETVSGNGPHIAPSILIHMVNTREHQSVPGAVTIITEITANHTNSSLLPYGGTVCLAGIWRVDKYIYITLHFGCLILDC